MIKHCPHLMLRFSQAAVLAGAVSLAGGSAAASAQNAAAISDPDPAPARTLTLEEAIDLALAQNREIGIAGDTVKHFQELRAKAKAEYFPKIRNESVANYITDLQGVVFPEGAFGTSIASGPIPPRTLRIGQGANATYYSSSEIVQPLTQLFAIHAEDKAAQSDVKTSKLQFAETRIETAVDVRRLYYAVLVSQKELEAAELRQQALEEADREAQANLQQGESLAESELQTSAQVAQGATAVLQARLQVHKSMLDLDDALGLPVGARLQLQPIAAAGQPGPALPTRAEALRLALAQEPKVLMAEEAVVKAKADLRAAEDAYIPELTAQAHESYQSGVPFFVHNYGVFGGQFSYNIFDGGARVAKIRDARALLSKAQLALKEQQEQTGIAVEVVYDQVEEAVVDLNSKISALKVSVEQTRTADAQFANGELLLAKRKQAHAQEASAEAAVLEATLNLTLARSQVERVLGQIPR